MESWRKTWREGMAPLLSTKGLEALAHALETDSPALLQGATTTPPPLSWVQDWPVKAACLVGLCGVAELGGIGTAKVGEVEEYFARLTFECDQRLNEPAGCRHLLNWYDETPRSEMRALLLPEVKRTLAERNARERASGLTADEDIAGA